MKRSAMLAGATALMVSAAATGRAGILNPNAFASLGGFSATGGQITINTDGTPTLRGPGSLMVTGVVSASGVAVFTFDGISLRDTFVVATGGRSLALLSRGDATFAGSTTVRAFAGGGAGGEPGETRLIRPVTPLREYETLPPRPGGGPGGGRAGGVGGSFGGTGGNSVDQTYGDLTLGILAGSGGGGAQASIRTELENQGGSGGDGGGGLEIGAIGSIGLDIGASLIADGGGGGVARFLFSGAGGGGSGGGIILNAQGVSLSGLISARGGKGGEVISAGAAFPGAGGGGGRVLVVAENLVAFSTATIDVSGGLPGAPKFDIRARPGQVGTVTLLSAVPVPEPGSIALLGLGVVGVLAVARGRRSRRDDQDRAA